MKKYYAYLTPEGKRGIVESWKLCEKIISGVRGARYKGFSTREHAEAWLADGAVYERKIHHPRVSTGLHLDDAIYFDSGTGRKLGRVEVKVANARGDSLLVKAPSRPRISAFGTYVIPRKSATNNYGELFALKLALDIALQEGVKKICGDSKLVIDFWSKGHIKRGIYHKSTYALVEEVTDLRKQFEERGGNVSYISGDENPADLGFHR